MHSKFAKEDIEELLKYAEDLTVIPSFPLAPASYLQAEIAVAECILWTAEMVRLGHNALDGMQWYVDAGTMRASTS